MTVWYISHQLSKSLGMIQNRGALQNVLFTSVAVVEMPSRRVGLDREYESTVRVHTGLSTMSPLSDSEQAIGGATMDDRG